MSFQPKLGLQTPSSFSQASSTAPPTLQRSASSRVTSLASWPQKSGEMARPGLACLPGPLKGHPPPSRGRGPPWHCHRPTGHRLLPSGPDWTGRPSLPGTPEAGDSGPSLSSRRTWTMWMGCGPSSLMYPKGWQHSPAPRVFPGETTPPGPWGWQRGVFWDQLPVGLRGR